MFTINIQHEEETFIYNFDNPDSMAYHLADSYDKGKNSFDRVQVFAQYITDQAPALDDNAVIELFIYIFDLVQHPGLDYVPGVIDQVAHIIQFAVPFQMKSSANRFKVQFDLNIL